MRALSIISIAMVILVLIGCQVESSEEIEQISETISYCAENLDEWEVLGGTVCSNEKLNQLINEYAVEQIEEIEYDDPKYGDISFGLKRTTPWITISYLDVPLIEGTQTIIEIEEFVKSIINDLSSNFDDRFDSFGIEVLVVFDNGDEVFISYQPSIENATIVIHDTEVFLNTYINYSDWIKTLCQEDYYRNISFTFRTEDSITEIHYRKQINSEPAFYHLNVVELDPGLEIDAIASVVDETFALIGVPNLESIN